jgi:hypothetical protein
MTLKQLVARARELQPLSFDQVVAVIAEHYRFTPVAFTNGLGDRRVENGPEQNQGSCKLLSFAKLHHLDQRQTLHLFGDYYYREVLADPQGSGHANIRAFMRDGWQGVRFSGQPLTALEAP